MARYDSASVFRDCNTEREVLDALARGDWGRPDIAGRNAHERIAWLRQKDTTLAALMTTFDAGPIKVHSPQPTQAAVIEFVETNPLHEEHQGVTKPNELRINGTPILVPKENFFEIENPENIGDTGLIVRVRMYARRFVAGEAMR